MEYFGTNRRNHVSYLESCELGEFLNNDNDCEPCANDKYMNVTWRDFLEETDPYANTRSCYDCPKGKGTAGPGSTSPDDCKSKLLPPVSAVEIIETVLCVCPCVSTLTPEPFDI